MEHWQGQRDDTEVAGAVLETLAARVTARLLVAHTKPLVEHSFSRWHPLRHLQRPGAVICVLIPLTRCVWVFCDRIPSLDDGSARGPVSMETGGRQG